METLKINHLAPYLPYGLKIQTTTLKNKGDYGGGSISIVKEVNGIYEQFEDGSFELYWKENYGTTQISQYIKLILRPLSDLNKDEFSYLAKVIFETNLLNRDWDDTRYLVETLRIRYLPKYILEKLYENHFDLEDLIGLDLAIDINTL